jgi:hypothetical protein
MNLFAFNAYRVQSKYGFLRNCLLYSLLFVPILGCYNQEKYKPFEKEFNDPMPTKYEAPYKQDRQEFRNDPTGNSGIPREAKIDPEVIEPDPYLPGSSAIMYGIPIKGKPGFVLSPYAPDKGFVDVRGFPVDSDVRDPYTGKIMKVPVPVEPEEGRRLQQPQGMGETLSTPSLDTPQLNDDLPPSPPVLEP